MPRIKGKVAKVLSSRELALNIGSEHGVKEGMLFDVLQPGGEDIKDPDTNTVIGSLERPKVRVKIVEVKDKLSVASTFQTYTVNVGGMGGLAGFTGSDIQKMLTPPKFIQKVQTLKSDEITPETIRENESFVKTGDPVVEVEEVELQPAPTD